MPELSTDLTGRYQRAFGFTAQNTISRIPGVGFGGKLVYASTPVMTKPDIPEQQTSGPTLLEANPTIEGSVFFDKITVEHPDFRGGKPYSFPILPMLDLSRAKKIVSTEVVDGDGEVVEYIGLKPWSIRFRGLLVDMERHQMPLGQLNDLKKLFRHGQTLRIESTILNLMDIWEIYITEFEPEFLEGFGDTIAYTIMAKSHVPVEIEILEEGK